MGVEANNSLPSRFGLELGIKMYTRNINKKIVLLTTKNDHSHTY